MIFISRLLHKFSGKALWGCVLATGLFLLSAEPVWAHKVTVFAWVEGDTVHGETKFSGGRPAMDAEIIVTDPAGNRLLTTRTDDQGEFSFPVPRKTALHIRLVAGTGHQGEWTVRAEEIGDVATAKTAAVSPAEAADSPEPAPMTKPVSSPAEGVSPDALQAMMEKTLDKELDKKLKPILRMLADAHDPGPSLHDVVGGIGYIFGLMGVGMYFQARRKLDQASRP